MSRCLPSSALKLLAPVCLGAILATGCARKSELAKAQGEVAELRAKIALLEQERVPRAELDQARTAAAAAQERVAALDRELTITREQLSGAQAQMVAAQERAVALERRAVSPETKVPEPPSSPGLAKGTYIIKDDTVVYSRDAQLNFANGVTITSPSGVMLSDKDREIVAGDLVVETPKTIVAPAAGAGSVGKPKESADQPPGSK